MSNKKSIEFEKVLEKQQQQFKDVMPIVCIIIISYVE